MQIAGLPFVFDVQGDPRAGGSATLRVALTAFTEEQFDQLRCVVAWFAQLGELGALGGDVLAPGKTRASLPTGEPDGRHSLPTWQFDAFAVDPLALSMLATLIHATGASVLRAELAVSGATSPHAQACDAYPARSNLVPFVVDESRTDRNVVLTVDFGSDVAPELHPSLTDAVRIWCLVAGLGGFRVPGPLRDQLDLIPEDEPELILDQLTLTVRDNGVHDAAYDTLVNLFAAVSIKLVPVVRLSME